MHAHELTRRGSTLSLAYAESHPERTAALVIRGIYLSTKQELDYTYRNGANRELQCPPQGCQLTPTRDLARLVAAVL